MTNTYVRHVTRAEQFSRCHYSHRSKREAKYHHESVVHQLLGLLLSTNNKNRAKAAPISTQGGEAGPADPKAEPILAAKGRACRARANVSIEICFRKRMNLTAILIQSAKQSVRNGGWSRNGAANFYEPYSEVYT